MYVTELFNDASPSRAKSAKGCLYVDPTRTTLSIGFGSTWKAVSLHPAGYIGTAIELRMDLCEDAPIVATREEAERLEKEWVEKLERDGYVVFCG